MRSIGAIVSGAALTCTLTAALLGSAPAPATAADGEAELASGQSLTVGQRLVSSGGQHVLRVGSEQDHEALTLTGASCEDRVLASDAQGRPAATRLTMQSDGNLVLYRADNSPAWFSGTQNNPGARAVLNRDRNLVVLAADGRQVWASNTSCTRQYTTDSFWGQPTSRTLKPGWYLQSADRRHRLVMQTDGNLVLYTGNRALWSTGTARNPGAYFTQQSDYNLVVYSATGRPLWTSGTPAVSGRWPTYVGALTLQNDGNLVYYKTNECGAPNGWLWQTRTRA